MRRILQKWGEPALAALCVVIILFAALYTRQEDLRRLAAEHAAGSQNETLADVTPPPAWQAPVPGEILQSFAGAGQTESGLWRLAPWVRFAASRGEAVCAMSGGTVRQADGGCVTLLHGNGTETCYRPLGSLRVSPGQSVTAGQLLGTAGEAYVEVCARRDGAYIDPSALR